MPRQFCGIRRVEGYLVVSDHGTLSEAIWRESEDKNLVEAEYKRLKESHPEINFKVVEEIWWI